LTGLERLRRGEWAPASRSPAPPALDLGALFSRERLGDIVADFLAKKDNPVGVPDLRKHDAGRDVEATGEAPDHEKLMARREECYRLGRCPMV